MGVIFFIIECGIACFLCTMHVFKGIILSPYATFVPNFVCMATSIAETAHGEKSRTQSITQSPSLFDAPGTKAFASEYLLYLFLASDQCSLVGLCMQDYKSLCAAVTISFTLVNIQTDTHTHRQHLTSLFDKLSQLS